MESERKTESFDQSYSNPPEQIQLPLAIPILNGIQ